MMIPDASSEAELSPAFKDPYEQTLLHLLVSDAGQREHDAGRKAALDLADRIMRSQNRQRSTRVEGAVAAEILRQCITRLHRVAMPSRHGRFGRYQWLWYLRRVPNVAFAGRQESTLPYDRALAEALAFTAAGPGASRPFGALQGHFPVTAREAGAIAWLIGYTRMVSSFHAMYRRCGKGAQLILDAERLTGTGGLTECDAETAAAIELYDARLDTTGEEHFLGADVVQVASGSMLDGPGEKLRLFARTDTGDITDVYVAQGSTWLLRYKPHDLVIDKLVEFISDPRLADPAVWGWPIRDTVGIIILGGVVTDATIAPKHALVNTNTATATGYVVIEEESLRNIWAEPFRAAVATLRRRVPAWAPHLDVDLMPMLRRLTATLSAPWPLRGHALVTPATNGYLAIDLGGASSQFFAAVRYPAAQGEIANARAEMFERRVQERIDATSWSPPAPLRAFRRRQLKRGDGTRFGEIDALGVRDGVCLVVSCKSRLYTDGHEVGDYRAVREAEQQLVRALDECDAFLSYLRATPQGPNYDLRGLELRGVVVTPHVFFMRPPAVNRMTFPDLRAYSTLGELQRWLDAHGGPA